MDAVAVGEVEGLVVGPLDRFAAAGAEMTWHPLAVVEVAAHLACGSTTLNVFNGVARKTTNHFGGGDFRVSFLSLFFFAFFCGSFSLA